jgi:putative endonuclease
MLFYKRIEFRGTCLPAGRAQRKNRNMYFVYILKSKKDNRFYTGLTKDIDRRIHEHNSGFVKATKSRIPFVLVYKEKVDTLQKARTKEKWLKSGEGREFRDSFLKIIPE